MSVLNIKPATTDDVSNVDKWYSNHGTYHEGDSGLDLFCMKTITVPANSRGFAIPLGICGQMITVVEHHHGAIKRHETVRRSYYMMPRSSISSTPLRLSNSVGLIDAGYTGELKAMVDNVSNSDYVINEGVRLFQVALPTLDPFTFKIVDALDTTSRGSGGFGSTTTVPYDLYPTSSTTALNIGFNPDSIVPMFGQCQ